MARYKTRQDDSLIKIARRTGTTPADLVRLNPELDNNQIFHPGQEIWVHDDTIDGGEIPEIQVKTHQRYGDNISPAARDNFNGMLQAINNGEIRMNDLPPMTRQKLIEYVASARPDYKKLAAAMTTAVMLPMASIASGGAAANSLSRSAGSLLRAPRAMSLNNPYVRQTLTSVPGELTRRIVSFGKTVRPFAEGYAKGVVSKEAVAQAMDKVSGRNEYSLRDTFFGNTPVMGRAFQAENPWLSAGADMISSTPWGVLESYGTQAVRNISRQGGLMGAARNSAAFQNPSVTTKIATTQGKNTNNSIRIAAKELEVPQNNMKSFVQESRKTAKQMRKAVKKNGAADYRNVNDLPSSHPNVKYGRPPMNITSRWEPYHASEFATLSGAPYLPSLPNSTRRRSQVRLSYPTVKETIPYNAWMDPNYTGPLAENPTAWKETPDVEIVGQANLTGNVATQPILNEVVSEVPGSARRRSKYQTKSAPVSGQGNGRYSGYGTTSPGIYETANGELVKIMD